MVYKFVSLDTFTLDRVIHTLTNYMRIKSYINVHCKVQHLSIQMQRDPLYLYAQPGVIHIYCALCFYEPGVQRGSPSLNPILAKRFRPSPPLLLAAVVHNNTPLLLTLKASLHYHQPAPSIISQLPPNLLL